MQGFGVLLVAIAVGLAAGCLLGAQPSVNGQLGAAVYHPLQAALVSFATGTTILIVVCLALGIFPPNFQRPPGSLPWWIWCGGGIGVVMVTTSLIFVPRIGSLPWFAAVMSGQILAALALDHFGWLGNPRAAVSPLRLVGAALMVASVLVVVYARQTELRQDRSAIGIPAEQRNPPNHG
jgi:transporter family-2 protein